MKGDMSISSVLMKIVTTAYIALVLLIMFFAINKYNLTFMENIRDRESLYVGDTVLSSCIAENYQGHVIKGLLSESKINAELLRNPGTITNISCLGYYKEIFIEIRDETDTVLYKIGNSSINMGSAAVTLFPATLNRTSSIIPVTLKIFIGF